MSGEVPSDEQLVSVVIPTYNRTHCLPRAVDSVLARTHSQVEVIVIAEHRDRIRLSDHMLREVLAEAHG